MHPSDQEESSLDLSCFPLLRIDQLHLHKMTVLVQSQEQISLMVDHDECHDFRKYASKLIDLISQEVARRRVQELLSKPDELIEIKIENGIHEDSRDSGNRICMEVEDTPPPPPPPLRLVDEKKVKSKIKDTASVGQSRRSHRQTQSNNYVVSSVNGHGNSGFKSRAKARSSAMKAKSVMDSAEYKNQLLEEDKRSRRKHAADRIQERRVRRATVEAQIERRRKQLEKEQAQQEKRDKVQKEMERVADDAKHLALEQGITEEQVHITAAIAAAEVMNKAEVDILESDAGSSLASEVDSITGTKGQTDTTTASDCESTNSNDDDLDETVIIHSDDTDGPEIVSSPPSSPGAISSGGLSNSSGGLSNDPHESHSVQKPIPLVESVSSENQLMVEYDQTAQQNIPLHHHTAKDHQCIHERPRHCTETKVIEWKPWSPIISQPSETSSSTRRNHFTFTTIYPTFSSIFSVFALAEHRELSDENINLERECLEYQIRVHASLSELEEYETESHGATQESLLFSTKSMRPEVTAIISDVLLDHDDEAWKDVSSELGLGNCWNLLWTWKKPKINPEHLLVCQRISRFQNTSCLTRKDYLKKNIERNCSSMASRQQSSWDIMPLTFVLPNQYTLFVSAFSSIQKTCQNKSSNIWIMKPVGLSRGRGITLINDIGKVSYSLPTVIQQYVMNPLLFQGFKFDLRLYVLVTSFSPLEAFIYREGFARFGTRKFSSHAATLDDLQIHLTNSSIQKNYNDDITSLHPAKIAGKDGGGNKVTITWLWKRLKKQGLDTDLIWKKTSELCLKTLLSIGDEIPNQPNAFEVFGFDAIIDEHMKPWLIEVNSCPALARETDLDVLVKGALIEDTIKVLSPAKYNRQALAEICKRRLYQKKRSSSKIASERDVLEQDLRRIFNNELPRQYGEEPNSQTQYERLAPGTLFDRLKNQRRSTVIQSSNKIAMG